MLWNIDGPDFDFVWENGGGSDVGGGGISEVDVPLIAMAPKYGRALS
jgi:hypothetical protein